MARITPRQQVELERVLLQHGRRKRGVQLDDVRKSMPALEDWQIRWGIRKLVRAKCLVREGTPEHGCYRTVTGAPARGEV